MTMCAPSGVTAKLLTGAGRPLRMASSVKVLASHTRAVLSVDPVTMRVPSGVTATFQTPLVWRSTGASSANVVASHTRAVPSREPVTMRVPSGVTAFAGGHDIGRHGVTGWDEAKGHRSLLHYIWPIPFSHTPILFAPMKLDEPPSRMRDVRLRLEYAAVRTITEFARLVPLWL